MAFVPVQKRQKGLVQLIPLLVIGLLVLGVVVAVKQSKQSVLSESNESGSGSHDSGTSGSSGSSGSGSNESGSGSSGSTSGSSTGTPKAEVRNSGSSKGNEIDIKEVELETEVETPELENENEFEVMEEGTESAKIKLGKKDNKFVFFEQKFGAESSFPVAVNQQTRQLTVTTPAGVKVVAVLPDSAVANMLAQNVIDKLLGTDRLVNINTASDGTVIYEIEGAKGEKFLGLFSVLIPKTAVVSAQNGQLLGVNETLPNRILDAFSF